MSAAGRGPRRRTVMLSGLAGLVAVGVPAGLYLTRSTNRVSVGLISAVQSPGASALLGYPSAVRFHPTLRILVSFHADDTVALWAIDNPSHPRRLAASGTAIMGKIAQFSPDGRFLATLSDETSYTLVTVWDITRLPGAAAADALATLKAPAIGAEDLAFHPAGRVLAVVGNDASANRTAVSLWDLTDPTAPALLSGTVISDNNSDIVTPGIDFSPDGRTLAATDGTTSMPNVAGLWDVTDPRRLKPLGDLTAAAPFGTGPGYFTLDGRVMVTTGVSGFDGALRTWNVADPRRPVLLASFSPYGLTQSPGTSAVNDLAFHPNGHTVATAGPDNIARLWSIADPAHPGLQAALTGHRASVNGVDFSRDGHILATSSSDHTVRLWNTSSL